MSVYLSSNRTPLGTTVSNGADPSALSPRAWHHVAFVADGARIKLWRDGTFVTSFPYPGTIITPAPTKRLEIGGNTSAASFQSYWDGKIDDAALWTRALTDEEMTAIYRAGLAGLPVTSVPEPGVFSLAALFLGVGGLRRLVRKKTTATASL